MREICTYGSMRGRAYPITRGVPLYSTPFSVPDGKPPEDECAGGVPTEDVCYMHIPESDECDGSIAGSDQGGCKEWSDSCFLFDKCDSDRSQDIAE